MGLRRSGDVAAIAAIPSRALPPLLLLAVMMAMSWALLWALEKSFPDTTLYCPIRKRYRFRRSSAAPRRRSQSLCDGTHTKLQLILQLEHTKRGAKA
ncbi:MAG: hypothetical protein VXW25_06010, partial [Pseudomonadota bacterium]|nr:hypothetical protein [Pseudomonadota bacterium]